ncbi:blue copper protein [Amaranthus tricolor]|uniref:blue copper protein n=1 Tax=Amaranthus tricolor TaxID=29722 RepID=UPI00258FCDF8|nr:blue copper protein [Amaranthus tricolor]
MMIARSTILACIGLVLVCLAVPSLGTVYTVGDSSGWTIGIDYGTWAASKTFLVGDTLVFNYGSGHTVDEVKQGDYTTCTIGNSLTSDNKGTTSILLQTPGTHYFICAIIGHCGSGMKLSVKVSASSPNSTSTSPPSSTTPTTTATPVATYPTSAGGSGSGTNNPYMIPYSASSTRSIKYLIIIMVIFLNLLLLLS